jgi:hypothetical protein
MKLFQVTYGPDGEVLSVIELPPEEERKRTLFIRESNKNKATKAAEKLFSFAK